MSKTFNFKKNSLKLTIEGNVFDVDMDDYIGNVEKADFFIQLGEKVKGFTGETKEEIEIAMKLCEEAVEELLGVGATDKIFANKRKTALRMIELIDFLNSEFGQFRMNSVVDRYRVTAEAIKNESSN